MQREYAYYRTLLAGQSLPCAFVDLDQLDDNSQHIAEAAGKKQVRLASKSIRCTAILRRLLDQHDCFQGIMCYSAREAVWLAEQGFTDLLVGYPTWQDADIAAVAHAVREGQQITLMLDSTEAVDHLNTIAVRAETVLPVCLEIDLSLDLPGLHFGVWRSPVRTPGQARPVIEAILRASHLRLDGIMGYEAQIAGVGDHRKGQQARNAMIRLLKRRSVVVAAERRAAILDLISRLGGSLRFVNGGGTGSLATTRREAGVTEITVGSGFYSPGLFDEYQDFRYQPAMAFAIEIVRRPRADLYTCLGGGYIASGAVGPEKLPRPWLPEGATLVALEGAGEVQTPVRYTGPIRLSPGDPVILRHAKAGEACEHFNQLMLIADGAVQDIVPTYRGLGQHFL